MIKNLLLSFLFLNSFVSFSQEIVSSAPVALKKNPNVFQTVNDESKEVTLFVSDKNKVKAIQLDQKMQIADSISSDRPNAKIYDTMIGYNISDNKTRLFWSSGDYEDIFSQLFDFSTHTVITQQYNLTLKDEKVLQKFSENNTFYILTVVKKSNTFKFHVFDKEGKYEQKTVDLGDFNFQTFESSKTNLYGIFQESPIPFEAPFTLQDIRTESPTSLTDAAKKRKCYLIDKQLTVTFDSNCNYTQIITIDLEHFTANKKNIKKHLIEGIVNYSLNSNSFFFENKLYQIKTSPDEFFFTIKDLNGTIIKEYALNEKSTIDFKNTDISQENGDPDKKRTLEKTLQFIRKTNNLNSGLACYHTGQNTLVTIGGVSENQQASDRATLGQFGLIGALTYIAIYGVYNPTMQSFNSYANRTVVKIDGLFDNDGNHIKGNLQPLAFDKIRTFFDGNKDVSAQTLFKTDNYYLGYYDNKTKEYIFRKFTD